MKYKLQNLPIKWQAYFIIIEFNGSWLYNALHEQLENEQFCETIVNAFLNDHSYDDDCANINESINDLYDNILQCRVNK